MASILKGKDLVIGKLYTFWGKNNRNGWPLYREKPSLNKFQNVTNLWPLEPFVFLGRWPSDLRFTEDDLMYDYKILTGNGTIGWLSLHDDDLNAFTIAFREYDPKEFEIEL